MVPAGCWYSWLLLDYLVSSRVVLGYLVLISKNMVTSHPWSVKVVHIMDDIRKAQSGG